MHKNSSFLLTLSCYLLLCLLAPSSGFTQTHKVAEAYKKWTFETRTNYAVRHFKSNSRMTYLSNELLQAWKDEESDNNVKQSIQDLSDTIDQFQYKIFLVEIIPDDSPGHVGVGWNMQNIKQRIHLTLTEGNTRKIRLDKYSGNLDGNLVGSRSYYGLIVFSGIQDPFHFSTVTINTTIFLNRHSGEILDQKDHSIQYSFLPTGAPTKYRPKRLAQAEDFLNIMRLAFGFIRIATIV